MFRALAGALLAAATISSCGGGGTNPATPRLVLSSCTLKSGLAARCGQFSVAENPASPNGRKISLRVVVLPATSSDHAFDPMFYFAGGPGGAASDDAAWAAGTFGTLNQRHDLVFIDQRGTGGSNRVACSSGDPSADVNEAAVAAKVQACLTSIKDKADPLYYSTPIAVDDFDLVRAALGYDTIDIYGGSYGVSSALAYIQRHDAHVRAAVLDSGSLLDYRLWQSVPRSAQLALNKLFARCHADSACARAFPSPEADFRAVTARLAVRPQTLYVTDPVTGRLVSLDLLTFLSLVVDHYLGNTQNAASLPRDIHLAAKDDWTAITQAFASGMGSSDVQVMTLTIRCSDEWAMMDPALVPAIAQGSAFTPMTLANATITNVICKYWPHAAGASGPVKTSVPIVFLNGTADPADPPANVANAQADMPNSLVVPVEGLGHGQISSDASHCLADEANTFLQLGVPPSPKMWACAQSVPLPDFVTA